MADGREWVEGVFGGVYPPEFKLLPNPTNGRRMVYKLSPTFGGAQAPKDGSNPLDARPDLVALCEQQPPYHETSRWSHPQEFLHFKFVLTSTADYCKNL